MIMIWKYDYVKWKYDEDYNVNINEVSHVLLDNFYWVIILILAWYTLASVKLSSLLRIQIDHIAA